MQIGEYLKNLQPTKPRTKRDVLKEIWDLLNSEEEKKLTGKKNATKFYKGWRTLGYAKYNQENFQAFKKSRHALRPMTFGEMAYRLAHLKTVWDYDYVLSVCKDKLNRRESVTAYIKSLVKIVQKR